MLVSIVIPLHNEEENIEELYTALKSVMELGSKDCELVFMMKYR
jgi:glycosyltransferase involved in cell wall biosynthesis